MAEKMRPKAATPVRATTHADKRSNIPTAELESFARPEEKRPTIVRYPRDPSLDPQLVWKGKDEQDAADLSPVLTTITFDEAMTVRRVWRVNVSTAGEQGMDALVTQNDAVA